MNSVCNTCLSRDRTLYCVGNLQPVLQCLTPELLDIISTFNICWECQAILRKFTTFRDQVLQAHTMLINNSIKAEFEAFTIPSIEREDKSYSSLTTKLNKEFDFTFESAETGEESGSNNSLHGSDDEFLIPPSSPPKKMLRKVKILKINPELPLFDEAGKLLIKNIKANLSKLDTTSPPSVIAKSKIVKAKQLKKEDKEKFSKTKLTKKTTKGVKKSVKKKVGVSKRSNLKIDEVENYVSSDKDIIDLFTQNMKKALHSDDIKNVTMSIMSEEEVEQHRSLLKGEINYTSCNYRCDKCIIAYYTEEQLQDHQKAKHQKGNKIHSLLCPICSSYIDKSMYTFHYGRHVVCYSCNICEHKAVDIKEMRAHQAKHRGETNTYFCEKCSMEFKTSYHLRVHNNRRHGEPMVFKRPGLVKRGVPKETSSRSYDCVLCDYKFQSRRRMKQHVETVHSNQEEKYHCSKCNITCNSFLSYKKHFRYTRAHIEDSPGKVKYICPYCGKPFTVGFIMKEHINYVHKGKTDYVCHICNKMLSSKGSLTKHIKYVHEGIKHAKDRPCNICGKFYNAATLRSHIRIHSDARPFVCKVCGDSFKQSGSLYTHIRLKHKRNNANNVNNDIGIMPQ